MKHLYTILLSGIVLCVTALFVWATPVTQASPTGGVITTCDDAHLATALSGGGTVTFNCGVGTLTITSQHTIANDTTIDGLNAGNPLTLTATGVSYPFYVNSGTMLTLTNVTIANSTGDSLGVVYSLGPLVISNSHFLNNQSGAITGNAPMTVTQSVFRGNGGGYALLAATNSPLHVSNSQFVSNTNGAIQAKGPAVIDNSEFENNVTPVNQGALYMNTYLTPGYPLTLTNSSFISNTGGAIFSYGGNTYINTVNFLSNTVTNAAGAGLWYQNASASDAVQILNSTFQNNTGGAIETNVTGGILAIDNSHFVNNTLGDGAIKAPYFNAVTVTNSSFVGNSTTYNNFPGALTLTSPGWISGTSFINNTGPQAGAMYMSGVGKSVFITNTQFLSNTSTTYNGGAIQAYSGNLSLSNVNITNNRALAGYGGGLWVGDSGSIVNIDHSLFYGNMTGSTGLGGALYANGFASIVNTTIYSNTANSGGGIYAYKTVTLTNTTLVNNVATYSLSGGNFHQAGITPGTMVNTILAGGNPKNCGGNPTSLGYNISSDTSCVITGTQDLSNTDPLLGPFQNNGGTTNTLMPTVASPAVNAGSNVYCPSDDQRGVARPIGGVCDIGAVESPYQSQTITFAPLPNRTLSQSPFTVSASATSGLTVYFTASGQCNASGTNGTTITLTALGSCTVTAHQDGNSTFASAPPVARTFSISTPLYLPLILR